MKIIDDSQLSKNHSNGVDEKNEVHVEPSTANLNAEFRICPSCSGKSLKTENGCDSCMDCGYSKCDK